MTKLKKRGPGRPRTEPEKRFNVRAEANELAQWTARARILGYTTSQWLRHLAQTAISNLSPADQKAVALARLAVAIKRLEIAAP